MADVGAKPLRRTRRYARTIFHARYRARRRDGIRADDLLHSGLWLFRRGHRAQPTPARPLVGVVRILDGDNRRADGCVADWNGSGNSSLHFLSAAHRKPLVLYRTGFDRRRIMDLVRDHDPRDVAVEAGKS